MQATHLRPARPHCWSHPKPLHGWRVRELKCSLSSQFWRWWKQMFRCPLPAWDDNSSIAISRFGLHPPPWHWQIIEIAACGDRWQDLIHKERGPNRIFVQGEVMSFSFLLDFSDLNGLIEIGPIQTRNTETLSFCTVSGGVQFAAVRWLIEASNPPRVGQASEQNIFLQFRERPHKSVTSNPWCWFLLFAFSGFDTNHDSSNKSRCLDQRKWLFPETRENFPKAKISFSDKHILFKDRWCEKIDFFSMETKEHELNSH